MSATYDACLDVERRGVELLKPFFERDSAGRWVPIRGHPQTERLQKECGDIFMSLPDDRMTSVEIKAEETYTGNLVFEDWSNARFIGDPVGHLREGSKPGWSLTCRAEVLAFAFLDRRMVGFCKTIDYLRFVYDQRTAKHVTTPVLQRKHRQFNFTILRLIPIRQFRKHFPFREYRVDQGELFAEDLSAIPPLVDDSRIPWRRPA